MPFDDLRADVALDIMMQDLNRSMEMNLIADSSRLDNASKLLLSNARALLRTTKGVYERVLKEINAQKEEKKRQQCIKSFFYWLKINDIRSENSRIVNS